jgi:hypothetical protein
MREIEEETINLLTFKNYYSMKKLMISSGSLSAGAFIAGSLFKGMHWPGAGILLTIGIAVFSLLFLPLLFVLKAREVTATRDKIVIALGCLVGTMFSLATLFTIMHWPGATMLWFSSIGLSGFVLLPVYFFTGIRRPETKLNTILMSILLVGVTGLMFTLMNTRPNVSQEHVRVEAYLQNEEMLKNMQTNTMSKTALDINSVCEQVKEMALQRAAGNPVLLQHEGRPGNEFVNGGSGVHLIAVLRDQVSKYNNDNGRTVLPLTNSVLSADPAQIGYIYSNVSLLTSITQVQMALALAENSKLAANSK